MNVCTKYYSNAVRPAVAIFQIQHDWRLVPSNRGMVAGLGGRAVDKL